MCSVMAAVGGILTGLSGYASYKSQADQIEAQAQSQASMYNAQAQAAEHNAKIEAKKQEQIADNYGQEARRLRARQRLSEGALRAQTGAAGLSMAGSSADILASGQEAYWQDQMTLLGNQRNDNYNSRVEQTNYLNRAAENRTAARNVQAEADRQIGSLKIGTILGTAASIVPFFGGGSSGGSSSGGWSANMDKYNYTGASGTWNAPLRLQTSPVVPFAGTVRQSKPGSFWNTGGLRLIG